MSDAKATSTIYEVFRGKKMVGRTYAVTAEDAIAIVAMPLRVPRDQLRAQEKVED